MKWRLDGGFNQAETFGSIYISSAAVSNGNENRLPGLMEGCDERAIKDPSWWTAPDNIHCGVKFLWHEHAPCGLVWIIRASS